VIRNTLSATKSATFSVQLLSTSHKGLPAPTGTGFFISPDGWFATAAHVVTEDGTPSGKVRADISSAWLRKEPRVPPVMCDSVTFGHVLPSVDLALLHVDFSKNAKKDWLHGSSGFPYLTVSSRVLDEGEPVYAFGYPLSSLSMLAGPVPAGFQSLSPRTTSAIVSATIYQTTMVQTPNDPKVYVLDKALNYGNSGGPIVATETGHVHAFCSRFQPVGVPQPHLKDASGAPLQIIVPSLYGIVSSLHNPQILQLLGTLGVPVSSN